MHELICKQLCKRYILGRFLRRNITNRAIGNEEHSSTRKLGDNEKWEQNLTWTLALSSNFITHSLFCSYFCNGEQRTVNEHGKQENQNGLPVTKQGIGNDVTDRPRVPGFVPCFIFQFPILVTSISANGSTLNYVYLMIYLLTVPDEFSPNISV